MENEEAAVKVRLTKCRKINFLLDFSVLACNKENTSRFYCVLRSFVFLLQGLVVNRNSLCTAGERYSFYICMHISTFNHVLIGMGLIQSNANYKWPPIFRWASCQFSLKGLISLTGFYHKKEKTTCTSTLDLQRAIQRGWFVLKIE